MEKTERGSEEEPQPKEPEKRVKGKKAIFTAIGIAAGVTAGAAGTLVLAPIALGALGFTSAGIAAGSIAAGMMSSAAIANGGAVAAGSLVAVLQSAGAVGLSAAATAATASAGGVIGGAVGFLAGNRTEKQNAPKPAGSCDDTSLSVPETGNPLDEEDSDDQEPGDSLVSMAPLK